MLIHINTLGWKDVRVTYNLRDIDSVSDVIQPVALHYRVGETGDFTNVPAAYVSDASGPGATLVTPVDVILPAASDNQSQVQIRIMTTDAVGSDEFIGIDDITITGAPLAAAYMTISKSAPATVDIEDEFTYTLTVANQTGELRTNVIITDSLPLSVTVGTISDGGVAVGNVVSWTVASLAADAEVTRTVQVTAPAAPTTLVNSDYGVWASDWLTRATGTAVQTQVTAPPPLVDIGTARGMINQTVTIAGRATMYTGGFFAGAGNAKFYVQDATGGIAVQCFGTNGTLPVVTIGDWVTVTGKIGTYNAETQIVPVNNATDVTVVDGDPGDAPAPLPKAISEINGNPAVLGWLVKVPGTLDAIRDYTYSYELDIVDGVGNTALVYIDKNTGMNVAGLTVGQVYEITAIAEIYTTKYQLKPRQAGDIVPGAFSGMLVGKTGPATVESGSAFNYTLKVENQTGAALTDLVISDTLPFSVTFASATPTGTWDPASHTITWTAATLADTDALTYTIAVTAPEVPTTLSNSAYAAWASNWPTPTTGAAVETIVQTPSPGIYPIYDLQYTTVAGDGTYPSLYVNETVTTTGTVCAHLSRGYIIADAPGPWHGLYIYNGTNAKPELGSKYLVRGTLLEYYGMTEFSYPGQLYLDDGDDVCAPSLVTAAQVPYQKSNASTTERYESVIVEVHSLTITAMTTNRALFTDSSGGTGAIGKDGYYPADMAVGQQYVYVRGPVIYTFDEYRIMPPTANDIKLLDVTPPTVTATIPATGAVDVSPHRPLYANFSEPVEASTVNAGSFTLTGPGGAVTGDVTYDAAVRQAVFTPNAALAANSLHTATLTAAIEDLAENPLVPHTWTFTTGPLDETPPTILASIPAPGAVDFFLGADVVITFSESLKPDTVIGDNFTLEGPYGATPWDSVTYNDAAHRLTLNPRGLLLPQSVYTLSIAEAVVDWGGNSLPTAQRTWSFTSETEPEMFAYHGDIHNHTSYSDGSGTPNDAFTKARAAGLDFLAVTDHSYSIDDTEWADTLAQANAHTVNGAFVAIRGFEYTQGAEGHINVYNTVRHAVRSDTTATCTMCDYTPNLEAGVTVNGFYPWLANPALEAMDEAGIIMMFNHPGWMNFNDWTYHPEVEHLAQLEEVGNGTGTSYFFSFDEWVRSLDYGWKLGATNNSDTHKPNWGEATEHRTGIVAPELTKRALFDAMRARRTFASEDANYEIFFKANGYWMGSELPNTGEIAFEISFNDPDGERTTLLELYSNQGLVLTYFQPNLADGAWNFVLDDIEPGVHYFFVKATQEDGDRIVTSPVWTMGDEDVSITDLTIQPTIPTIYNPSLLTARVTNRGLTAHALTVTFEVDGEVIGEVPVTAEICTVGPCRDAFAQIAWQPTTVGPVEFRATLHGAPPEDNPRDNSRAFTLTVTDEKVPLILIDGGHNNVGISPREVSSFVADMTYHGYNVLFNLDEITASDLNTETVRLLVINAYGPQQLTADEITAIADFVAAGGSLWLNGLADYTGKVAWADTTADRFNGLLAAIEAQVGQNIPMRMNDDQVADGNDNNGYKWGVVYHIFPEWEATGVGVNVEEIQTWSICSLMSRDRGPLTPAVLGPNGFLMVQGDLDEGSSSGAHYSNTLNRTHNSDEDSWGDAYIYPADIPLAGAAGYDIPGAGRIFMYGDSNDAFNTFAYVAGDGRQNELFNLQTVMWLLGNPLQKQDIVDVRPVENLHTLVWVEGIVTAAYGEFFNVLYVQDETGGITVHAPAGDIYAADYIRGKRVRVVGTVGAYQGDMEIEFFEAEMVQVIGEGVVPDPLPMRTYDAGLFENQGWLAQVTGTVTAKSPELDTLWVDDGSGAIRVFLDGYNGTWADVVVGDYVTVWGLTSADGEGARIRVRHYQRDERPDDLIILGALAEIALTKTVTPTTGLYPGDEVTYTLTLYNGGDVAITGIALTDVLPWEVNFASWIVQSSATVSDDVVTWSGDIDADETVVISFRAVVRSDSFFLAHPVVNVATFAIGDLTGGSASATFILGGVTKPTLVKTVATPDVVLPGDTVTYTLVLHNPVGVTGGVLLTDTLPAEVDFGGWVAQNGASVADDVITWSGDLEAGETLTIVFKAILHTGTALFNQTITNRATFTADNAGPGTDEASFTVGQVWRIFLPLTLRDS